MKPGRINLLSVLVFSFLLTGCQKDYIVSEGQDILFQQEYINYAWSYQHYGYIIDSDGNVFSFNKPAIWNYPDKDNKLSEQQAKENISNCTFTGKQIPKTELQKYINYINNISASRISSPRNVGADMGSLIYYCYQYSESSLTYKATKIKMEGDVQCENLNFFSKKVVDWMNEIRTEIPGL